MSLLLGQTAVIHSRLASIEKDSTERLEKIESQTQDIASRLDQALAAVEEEIANSQVRTRTNVNDLESRLQKAMSSVQGNLREISAGLKKSAAAAEAVRAAPAAAQAPASPPAQAEYPAQDAGQAAVKAPTVDPQDLLIQKRMKDGLERYRESKYGEAAKLFGEAVGLQPENVDARLYRAVSSYRASPGDSAGYQRIESDLRIVLQSRRDDALALETLGMVYAERARWDEALEWLSQAVSCEPGNVRTLREAASCAVYAGEGGAAESYIDQACQSAPADAEVWLEAGRVYAAGGKYGEAVERFSRSLSLDPRNASAMLDLGRAYMAMGEKQEGTEVLKKLIQEHPGTEAADLASKELKASSQ